MKRMRLLSGDIKNKSTKEISNNTLELQKMFLIHINHHMSNSWITSINHEKISRFQKDILKHMTH